MLVSGRVIFLLKRGHRSVDCETTSYGGFAPVELECLSTYAFRRFIRLSLMQEFFQQYEVILGDQKIEIQKEAFLSRNCT